MILLLKYILHFSVALSVMCKQKRIAKSNLQLLLTTKSVPLLLCKGNETSLEASMFYDMVVVVGNENIMATESEFIEQNRFNA